MAARAGGYYGTAFSGERGVTQGDPLSPTLYNVVVDAVVRHWLEGLQAEKYEKDAEGGERHFLVVFYADDGMVGATDPQWLQGAFSALVAILDRVGLMWRDTASAQAPDGYYVTTGVASPWRHGREATMGLLLKGNGE